jgi:hypothetical protein
MYKTMKHGVSMQGQSVNFKLRFSNEMPNFLKEMNRICYWIDSWKTEYKGKEYCYIAGSFHSSHIITFTKSRLRASALRDIERSLQILEANK